MKELDPELLLITTKRFRDQLMLLPELIDEYAFEVKQFFKNCKTPLDAINKVIVKIKYPLDRFGNPTDFHYYQAFKNFIWGCKKCYRNDWDYWQKSSETAWLEMGDCEDSSILTAAGLELLKVPYFVAFGKVYKNATFLGYHAWIVTNVLGWRLVETTLDQPYKTIHDIPAIDPGVNCWYVGAIKYEAMVLWNKRILRTWEENMSNPNPVRKLHDYMKASFKEKETKKKYRALNEEYKAVLGYGTKVRA